MSRNPLVISGLVVLVALAAVLRLRGNDYLLPLQIEPDAHIPVQVTLIEEGVEDPNRDVNYGKYPHLVARTTVALSETPPLLPAEASLADHLERAKDPVLRVRTAVGWLSLLGVIGTWLLAVPFVGVRWALVAAGFLATSLLAVHFGAQSRPHGAAVGFFALCLWACTSYARRGDVATFALASVFFLLAFGTLQSALALGFPLLVAHLLASRSDRGARLWALVLPAAALVLSVAIFSPFFLASSEGVDGAQVELKDSELEQAGHKLIFDRFNGRGFGKLAIALWNWEPALLVGLVLALLTWLSTRTRRDFQRTESSAVLVVLSFLIPYLAVCGAYERVYERFLLPVLPVFAVFVAWGLRLLARLGPRPPIIGLSTILLLAPAAIAWRLGEIRVAPSTQELAAGWLEQNSEVEDRVLVTLDLRLPLFETYVSEVEEQGGLPDVQPAQDRIQWTEYQHHILGPERPEDARNLVWMPVGKQAELLPKMNQDPARYVERRFGDLLVAMLFDRGRWHPSLGKIHAEFRQQGKLLARFSPDGTDALSEHPLAYQDETCPGNVSFAWRVWNAERMGPVIEIIRPPHSQPPSRR